MLFLEEKKKECNIWRRNNYFFAEEKKNGEGKGEKYLEKENQKGGCDEYAFTT